MGTPLSRLSRGALLTLPACGIAPSWPHYAPHAYASHAYWPHARVGAYREPLSGVEDEKEDRLELTPDEIDNVLTQLTGSTAPEMIQIRADIILRLHDAANQDDWADHRYDPIGKEGKHPFVWFYDVETTGLYKDRRYVLRRTDAPGVAFEREKAIAIDMGKAGYSPYVLASGLNRNEGWILSEAWDGRLRDIVRPQGKERRVFMAALMRNWFVDPASRKKIFAAIAQRDAYAVWCATAEAHWARDTPTALAASAAALQASAGTMDANLTIGLNTMNEPDHNLALWPNASALEENGLAIRRPDAKKPDPALDHDIKALKDQIKQLEALKSATTPQKRIPPITKAANEAHLWAIETAISDATLNKGKQLSKAQCNALLRLSIGPLTKGETTRVFTAIDGMYKQDVYHGDLHDQNILFRRHPRSGELEFAVHDFDYAFNFKNDASEHDKMYVHTGDVSMLLFGTGITSNGQKKGFNFNQFWLGGALLDPRESSNWIDDHIKAARANPDPDVFQHQDIERLTNLLDTRVGEGRTTLDFMKSDVKLGLPPTARLLPPWDDAEFEKVKSVLSESEFKRPAGGDSDWLRLLLSVLNPSQLDGIANDGPSIEKLIMYTLDDDNVQTLDRLHEIANTVNAGPAARTAQVGSSNRPTRSRARQLKR